MSCTCNSFVFSNNFKPLNSFRVGFSNVVLIFLIISKHCEVGLVIGNELNKRSLYLKIITHKQNINFVN